MPSTRLAVRAGRWPEVPTALLILAAALAPCPAWATILLFDEQRDAATDTIVGPTMSGGRVPGDYGDNVSGPAMAVPGGVFTYGEGGEGFTPNVAIDIYSSGATQTDAGVRLWQTGYGDLVNSVFSDGPGTEGSPILYVHFAAEPGYDVDLYGFDLAGFGSDYTIAGVQVQAGAVSLFSETNALVEGNGSGPLHTTFAFGTPLSAPDLLLSIDVSNLAAGIQDNVAIDSIRFGQTPPVPEPGTALLLCAGLAWMAGLRAAAARRARARRALPRI